MNDEFLRLIQNENYRRDTRTATRLHYEQRNKDLKFEFRTWQRNHGLTDDYDALKFQRKLFKELNIFKTTVYKIIIIDKFNFYTF